jgi:hypothetical protein
VIGDSMVHYHRFSLVYLNMIEQYESMICNIYMIEISLISNTIEIRSNYK